MKRKFERVGTPKYMPYEMVNGGTSIDHRIDIWCLGVVLYVLLFAEFPFKPHDR